MSITYMAIKARAAAYGVRATRTKAAVERLQARFEERSDSARYLSEGMTILNVDDPTTSAYMEVSTLAGAMAGNVASIVSSSDTLAAGGRELGDEATAQHGRMTDANRTHTVQMAQPAFIKPQ